MSHFLESFPNEDLDSFFDAWLIQPGYADINLHVWRPRLDRATVCPSLNRALEGDDKAFPPRSPFCLKTPVVVPSLRSRPTEIPNYVKLKTAGLASTPTKCGSAG